ncbi:thioesterase II family protein [Amycolatopsis jiangsuensis]|uniref:Surfactin synthase thioesterase subunit n=1 Tax=Amycolatopsis jiangsuensis TaxID=1181879 RepID=A0A840J6F9_9PSEU|nr:alpha/beta fold hydrolase [Amycolatopsis jiangsuensis]MBB4688994.1 surfactin synthase thioesterase subunit [Amycolatopsis jiangsuensis]
MTGSADTDEDSWFRRFHSSPGARARLVCFPHAGGSAPFYFPVSKALAPDVEVLAVQYPGRQDRRHEPFLTTISALAERIAALVRGRDDLPLALFGHSMGAMVAYEVARILEAAGSPVEALYVSGRRAPSRHRDENVHTRTDDGVLDELRRLSGTEMDLLGDDDVVRMILPVVRNDYRAVETYRYQPGPPLAAPVVAFTGTEDPVASVDEVRSWGEHTAGDFELVPLAGGHFFLTRHQDVILRHLTDRLVDRGRAHV